MKAILTHPGSAHKDDLLACCVLAARHGVAVLRREPTPEDLADPRIAVVDTGGMHDPARANFDHHQFPADSEPVCALSLVLQDLGLYEDARLFCDWLETAERIDARGPFDTAAWLGVPRPVLDQLASPVDITLLRRFALQRELHPGDPLWEVMRMVGEDLLMHLDTLRERLDFLTRHAQIRDAAGGAADPLPVLFLPRTEPLPEDPSSGLDRYARSLGEPVLALVHPDRRGPGYALTRHEDCPELDFTRISAEEDVHFAHARGFVAKTAATELPRLLELVRLSRIPGPGRG